eukprot:6096450-Amphidinium_carterae.1
MESLPAITLEERCRVRCKRLQGEPENWKALAERHADRTRLTKRLKKLNGIEIGDDDFYICDVKDELKRQ